MPSNTHAGQSDAIRLLDVIGKGSFGVVHRAIWRGSLVAAKVLPMGGVRSEVEAMIREVDACRLSANFDAILLL